MIRAARIGPGMALLAIGLATAASHAQRRSAPVPPAMQRALQYVEIGRLPVTRGPAIPSGDPFAMIEESGLLFDAAAPLLGPTDAARYRQLSADSKLRILRRTVPELREAITRQRAAVDSGARAVFVLGRASRDPDWLVGGIPSRHAVLLAAQVRQDARNAASFEGAEEELNRETDAARNRLEALLKSRGTQPPLLLVTNAARPAGITIAAGDAVEAVNASLLAERSLSPVVNRILDDLHRSQAAWQSRVPYDSLAPVSPMADPQIDSYVPADTPLPTEDFALAPERRGVVLAAPEKLGIELTSPAGATVLSPAPGTVEFAGETRGLGHVVLVRHEAGLYSVFARLASSAVEVGKTVDEGAVIGRAGAVPWGGGFGLYYEVRQQEQPTTTTRLLGGRDPARTLLGRR